MKNILLTFILFAISNMSFAQKSDSTNSKSIEHKAQFLTEKIKNDLKLSQDQQEKLFILNLKRFQEYNGIAKNGAIKSKEIEKIRNEYKYLIMVILNDEQKTMYNVLSTELKQNKQEYFKDNPSITYNEEDYEFDY
jgi:hypothetical protein